MRKLLILLILFSPKMASAIVAESLVPPPSHVNKTLDRLAVKLNNSELRADSNKLKAACGDFAKAKPQLSRGLLDDAELYSGYCSELLGDFEAALSAYERSLAVKANNPIALYRAGRALEELGRCDEAELRFKEVIWRLDQNSHEARFHLAKCQAATEQPALAAKSLKLAIEEKPDYTPALKLRNELRRKALSELSDSSSVKTLRDKMIADYRTILAQEPGDSQSASELARLLIMGSDPVFDVEKLKEAQEISAKLVESSNYKNADFARLYFDVLLARRDLDQAKEVIQRALVENPANAALLEASLQLEIELGAEIAGREKEDEQADPS